MKNMKKILILNDIGGEVMSTTEKVTSTLREQMKHHEPIICYAVEGNVVDRKSNKNGKGLCKDVSPTLDTQDRHAVIYGISRSMLKGGMNAGGMPVEKNIQPSLTANGTGAVAYAVENHPNDSRVTIDPDGIVQCLSSRMGTGGNNTPFVLFDQSNDQEVCNSSGDGISAPIDASYYKGQGLRQGIEREYVAMKAYATGNGQLANSVISDETVGTLDCMHDQKMVIIDNENNSGRKYVLRRLTPLECLRLQGLPDWWVDGADGSDSAIYRMAGNGIAIPCAVDVLGRIAEELQRNE